jgi:23S rRNA (adenine2503-C2)-methyltransferase
MKLPVAHLRPEEIVAQFGIEPKFRGRQIFKWIQKGIRSFAEMSDLPEALRAELGMKAFVSSSRQLSCYKEDRLSAKLRIGLADGLQVESVLLVDEGDIPETGEGRKTACLSSQVGCGMGCGFCKTAEMGFKRNLAAYEIVEQFHHLCTEFRGISNIVFMGMGEPLLNLSEVRKAIEILHHPEGRNIGLRKITISTCGIVKGIEELASSGLNVRLAFSLITADEIMRKKLMPITASNPLGSVKKALAGYQQKTKKWITLEVVVLKGITDREEDIAQLIAFISGLKAHVNIIPFNPAPGLLFERPDGKRIQWFRTRLEDAGIIVTQRYRKGDSIHAACGQLFTGDDGS